MFLEGLIKIKNISTTKEDAMESFVEKLNTVTFSVHHNPNFKEGREYQVRLIGKARASLDNILKDAETHDVVGYGKTMEEAAKAAWQAKFGVSS